LLQRKSVKLIIVPVYKKFFYFLDLLKRGKPAWPTYWQYYYFPYRHFFNAYFSFFPLLDREALKKRVEAIHPEHYSRLRLLLQAGKVEKILKAIHQRSLKLARPEKSCSLKVYLIIGFFSPEAFLLPLKKEKVIVFGLERWRDLSSLDLFYAHEYAHWLLETKVTIIPEERKAFWYLLVEGLACWFSGLVLPQRPLTDHLFLRRDRLNWCLENESFLKEIFENYKHDLEKIMMLEQQGEAALGLPPRTLHFLGYRAWEQYFAKPQSLSFQELVNSPEELLNLISSEF